MPFDSFAFPWPGQDLEIAKILRICEVNKGTRTGEQRVRNLMEEVMREDDDDESTLANTVPAHATGQLQLDTDVDSYNVDPCT